MLIFSALVAGSFSLGSLAANEIAPTALNAVRFVLASILIGLFAWRTGDGIPHSALASSWRYLVLGGFFSVYFVLMFEGLKTAPPVSAAAVLTMTPIMTAICGWLLLRQVTTWRMATALLIGAIGALWVIFRADMQALMAFGIGRGEAIYFVGCAAHALYIPLVRMLNRGERPLVFTFGTLLGGTAMLLIYGWPAIWQTDWANLSPIVWITIAYTAAFATALSFVLTQFAALRLPSAKVMAYTYLVPVWVICWQVVLGANLPTPLVLTGVLPIVVALLMLLKDEERTIPA